MPELPEVEVVRRGLDPWVRGARIVGVTVHHPRAIRRHLAGANDFAAALVGTKITDTRRRGKFLWFPLDSGDVLLGHLGMSGQFIVNDSAHTMNRAHLRVSFTFEDDTQLYFLDQRTFGGLWVEPGAADGTPPSIAHIAPDLLDPAFAMAPFAAALKGRRTEIKRALLDQTLISGVGNIYADEALWRAQLHYRRPTASIQSSELDALVAAMREVFAEALTAGGTSFDALYVNVNGNSGYFDRSLKAYGQKDRPCPRCGTPIVREAFTNRSSFYCPRCQVL
jgi:formamidopyrimidine-DNA glycosylase